MTALDSSQAALDSKVSIIHQDTAEIKSMITEIFQALKGASTSSVSPTLAITAAPANVEGENIPETLLPMNKKLDSPLTLRGSVSLKPHQ
jgi:hypothetical protein